MSGTIYFIGPWGFKVVKIGFATSWRKRLHSLQIGNPEELKLYALIRGTQDEEKALHERFADRRIRGEWFDHLGTVKAYLTELRSNPLTIYHRANAQREPR